jgi:hypothetical protein
MVTMQTIFWSSIIAVNSYVDLQLGAAFINLMKALALFLSVMIVAEVAIALNAQRKDAFSNQVWPIKIKWLWYPLSTLIAECRVWAVT